MILLTNQVFIIHLSWRLAKILGIVTSIHVIFHLRILLTVTVMVSSIRIVVTIIHLTHITIHLLAVSTSTSSSISDLDLNLFELIVNFNKSETVHLNPESIY